jgi:hypothetical protein
LQLTKKHKKLRVKYPYPQKGDREKNYYYFVKLMNLKILSFSGESFNSENVISVTVST